MRDITANGGKYAPGSFLKAYVDFMTTPGTHNDTYAESFHRDFFRNWANGVPPEQCARGTEGHDTGSIGGFVVRCNRCWAAALRATPHRQCCRCYRPWSLQRCPAAFPTRLTRPCNTWR